MSQNISSSSNRIPEILKRLQINCQQPEAIKTCFGLLAILSREDSHKLVIAKEGLELILASMNNHIDRVDIQEAGCDLLWSLAFNSNQVKDIVVKYQGASVVVKALKKHARTSDFLKSACGALSNLCQVKANQDLIFQQGGLQPLVNAIQIHQLNAKLLPFIFDAIASVIVNQEENTKSVSSLGLIQVVLNTLQRHKMAKDIVKSGCHTLAILSDVKDQAGKISQQGGVGLIISLIDFHGTYSELHRVAAVVLLRMLQENSQGVGKDIVTNEGVRVLLQALDRVDVQQDTVAAITHILYTVSNPPTSTIILPGSLEKQLWMNDTDETKAGQGNSLSLTNTPAQANTHARSLMKGIVKGISNFTTRRDVVRAACRLIMNLRNYDRVYLALDDFFIVEKLLVCSVVHKDAKDVLEATILMTKHINKLKGGKIAQISSLFSSPSLYAVINSTENSSADEKLRTQILNGLLLIVKHKGLLDEDFLASIMNYITVLFIQYTNVYNSANLISDEKEHLKEKVLNYLDKSLMFDGISFLQFHIQTIVSIFCSLLIKKTDDNSSTNSNSTQSSLNGSVLTFASQLLNKDLTAVGKNVFNDYGGFFFTTNYKNPIKSLIHFKEWLDCLIDMGYFKSVGPSLDYSIAPEAGSSTITPENLYALVSLLGNALSEKFNFLQLKDYLHSELSKESEEVQDDSKDEPSANDNSEFEKDSDKESERENEKEKEKEKVEEISSVTENTSSDTTLKPTSNNNHGTNNQSKPKKSTNKSMKKNQLNSMSASCSLTSLSTPSSLNSYVSNHLPPTIYFHKKFYPLHPCKEYYHSNPFNNPIKKLIDNWPNFYEKLISPTAPMFSDPNSLFLDGNGEATVEREQGQPPEKAILCYESNKPAGRNICPKFSTHMPYSDFIPQSPSSLTSSLPSDYNIDDSIITRSSFSTIYLSNSVSSNQTPVFQNTLTFDSEFECGNLYRAIQTGETTYDLVLRSDINSLGHTQWFYFAVSNTHAKSMKKGEKVKIKFNIINFTKPDSLFNFGMQPCIYSTKKAKESGQGWVRSGSDISYFCNYYNRNSAPPQFTQAQVNSNILAYNFQAPTATAGEGKKWYYSLTFTIEFSEIEDTTLIAYGYPYAYTDYKIHLQTILERPHIETKMKNYKLCSTLAGNDCDLFVITDYTDNSDQIGPLGSSSMPSSSSTAPTPSPNTNLEEIISPPPEESSPFTIKGKKKNISSSNSSNSNNSTVANTTYNYIKPALFFSCRVHPGEIPSSWIMKGLIDFLVSDCPSAIFLRKFFVIFLVPMLNPDGVIFGNNRCSLAGVDLNRQWKTPSKQAHPTIYHFKSLIAIQKKYRDIALYVDFHGHSRKYNVFFYGCEEKKSKNSSNSSAVPRYLSSTTSSMANLTINASNIGSILSNSLSCSNQNPRSLSKFCVNHPITKKFFNYDDCAFHLKKGRDSTARIVVSKEFNIGLSFTMEATFCSIDFGNLKNNHLNIGHFIELGIGFGDALWQFAVAENWIPYNREGYLITNSNNPNLNQVSLSQVTFNNAMLSSLLHQSHCDGQAQNSLNHSSSTSNSLIRNQSNVTNNKDPEAHNCMPLESTDDAANEDAPPTARSSCFVESDSEDSDNDFEVDENFHLEKDSNEKIRSNSTVTVGSQSSNNLVRVASTESSSLFHPTSRSRSKADHSSNKGLSLPTKTRSFSEGTADISNSISNSTDTVGGSTQLNDMIKNKFFTNNNLFNNQPSRSSNDDLQKLYSSGIGDKEKKDILSIADPKKQEIYRSISPYLTSSNKQQPIIKSSTYMKHSSKSTALTSSSFNHAYDVINGNSSTSTELGQSANALRNSTSKEDLHRLSSGMNSLAHIGANIVSKRDFTSSSFSLTSPSTSTAVSSSNPCTSRVLLPGANQSYKNPSFSK